MIGDKTLFSPFTPNKSGFVFYGDNNKVENVGFGIIGKFPSPVIREVILVKGLTHSLPSISQLCDKGKTITFDSFGCMTIKSKSNEINFTSSRSRNIYTGMNFGYDIRE